MKHATKEELFPYKDLLDTISKIDGMKEKQYGHFYFLGKNVLHFHEDKGQVYADIGNNRYKMNDITIDQLIQEIKDYMNMISEALNS